MHTTHLLTDPNTCRYNLVHVPSAVECDRFDAEFHLAVEYAVLFQLFACGGQYEFIAYALIDEAGYEPDDVWAFVVALESAPTLERLFRFLNDALRPLFGFVAACHHEVDHDVAHMLAVTAREPTRFALALNPGSPSCVLETLAFDRRDAVAAALSMNDSTPGVVIEGLMHHPSFHVRRYAAEAVGSPIHLDLRRR